MKLISDLSWGMGNWNISRAVKWGRYWVTNPEQIYHSPRKNEFWVQFYMGVLAQLLTNLHKVCIKWKGFFLLFYLVYESWKSVKILSQESHVKLDRKYFLATWDFVYILVVPSNGGYHLGVGHNWCYISPMLK